MIELYTFTTPNGRKPTIMLEELEIPYNIHVVDIRKNDQFTPEYIAINPNSKIPAIVDTDTDIKVFESAAILMYLAEKTGKFLPTDTKGRYQVIEWLIFQVAGLGPMSGQFNHFKRSAPVQIPYAIERYEKELLRLYGVLNRQLGDNEYIAGEYSIADIAHYPWIAIYSGQGINIDEYPHLKRWLELVQKRPGVIRGMALPKL